MTIYTTTAENFSEESENQIHNDDTAQSYGFQGALVPGVAVFGHMTYPLVDQFGEDWLSGYQASIRLLKPTYSGDELTIEHTENAGEHLVRCTARNGTLIAEMHSRKNSEAIDPIASAPSGPDFGARAEIEWDDIFVGEPFPAWTWQPTDMENDAYTTQISDMLAIYPLGVVHPHAILSMANRSFSRRYVLPAWLHVGSDVRFHRALRVGDLVEIHTVPIEKWKKKGHEFIDLYLSYLVDGQVAVEIKHTAIYKMAAASDAV